MRTSFASPNPSHTDGTETFGAKLGRTLIGAAAAIVNKFFQALEAAQDREALRRLTRQQLDDIGLSPFDRDRLLS
jgi:uncharacterized protein YjiS (DUF1127 family)